MVATTAQEMCMTPTKCPSLLDGNKGGCGYKALRGDEWCLRENPGGTIGLPMGEGWRSPFQCDEGEER